MKFLSYWEKTFIKEVISLGALFIATLSTVILLFKIAHFSDIFFLPGQMGPAFVILFIYLLPPLFKILIPVALIFSTFYVANRWVVDGEWEGLLSFGIGFNQWLKPLFILGLFCTLISGFTSLYIEPFARQQWGEFKWVNARESIESLLERNLKEKTFISELFHTGKTEISFYANNISSSHREFSGIFLAVRSPNQTFPTVILAQKGSLLQKTDDASWDYVLTLEQGRVYEPQYQQWNTLNFTEFKISLVHLFYKQFYREHPSHRDIRTFYPVEYINELSSLRKDTQWKKNPSVLRHHSFFFEQIIFALSNSFFSFLGFFLGIQNPRKKSILPFLGLMCFLLCFYLCIVASQQLILKWFTNPIVSLLLPLIYMTISLFITGYWRLCYPYLTSFFEACKMLITPKNKVYENTKNHL